MRYTSEDMKQKIADEYPAIQFFVDSVCSNCKRDCHIPSQEAVYCLLKKVSNSEKNSQIKTKKKQNQSSRKKTPTSERNSVNKQKKKPWGDQIDHQTKLSFDNGRGKR